VKMVESSHGYDNGYTMTPSASSYALQHPAHLRSTSQSPSNPSDACDSDEDDMTILVSAMLRFYHRIAVIPDRHPPKVLLYMLVCAKRVRGNSFCVGRFERCFCDVFVPLNRGVSDLFPWCPDGGLGKAQHGGGHEHAQPGAGQQSRRGELFVCAMFSQSAELCHNCLNGCDTFSMGCL
jgi:hypothetical protein